MKRTRSMIERNLQPGVVAFTDDTERDFVENRRKVLNALRYLGAQDPVLLVANGTTFAAWGPPVTESRGMGVLSNVAVRGGRSVPLLEVLDLVNKQNQREYAEFLPPFGSWKFDAFGRAEFAVDYLGFSQLYYGMLGSRSLVSTSARLAARLLGSGLDLDALAIQSKLGWQVGSRTIFRNVWKVPPAGVVTLERGGVEVVAPEHPVNPVSDVDVTHAAASLAERLRQYLEGCISSMPEAVLQLTGGQDSRILLSAIPPSMRRGLHVMTVAVPGSEDAAIARTLAARFGMQHHVRGIDTHPNLESAGALAVCANASEKVDCMADPVALAAGILAETQFEQGVRISGLGGEVARGFYYMGRVSRTQVSQARASRLAKWRMFANESVSTSALAPEFGRWSDERASAEIFRRLSIADTDWFRATDEFYLWERMQRWAGVTDGAVGFDRRIVNPMLDREFIDGVRALPPSAKAGSRLLAEIQCALDRDLALVKLNSRPPPIAYTKRGLHRVAASWASDANRAVGKVRQQIAHSGRPPAGGAALSSAVMSDVLTRATLIEPLRTLELFDSSWLDSVLVGSVRPTAATVALMINLMVATDAVSAAG